MVYRIYVEKREHSQAQALKEEIVSFLGIESLKDIRFLNRYDVENIDETDFLRSKSIVFSEPQTDEIYHTLPAECTRLDCHIVAVEYLPGQFDQRADSAAQCIQLLFQKQRPLVRNARVYCLFGAISDNDLIAIKSYLINPVESREASLAEFETLITKYLEPEPVPVLQGFRGLKNEGLEAFLKEYSLAMDLDDLTFCQAYFIQEKRDPTLTELRVIDTYWSDHCRHTTFLTELTRITFENPAANAAYREYQKLRNELGVKKPVTLMHLATFAKTYLQKAGYLARLDESDEVNACTVKVNVKAGGKEEPWLLLFKNETHNHPTEIEPFGGAATCIGGAIRDPLSGRAYVYQAMRVTGAGDPRIPLKDTPQGKLPQRRIVTDAAAGYSSYGNQIGLATGLVDEIYHPGYVAKRMEIGAVVGAAPQNNVRRETPSPGDIIVLIGGRTGRDGCGGATGSSKTHRLDSIHECAAEVQKGNAPEERKLQRLFRNETAARLIKRCNDFGAGGVCVAIGELADGLFVNLDAIPKKYEGLSGTELAISESQERMAVVLAPEDVDAFLSLAAQENLEATPVAEVTEESRLRMRFGGNTIVDISREFLNTNGARKYANAIISRPGKFGYPFSKGSLFEKLRALVADLNVCDKRGLIERFDSTIGVGSILMPLGGNRQITPSQVMAAKIPLDNTTTCSMMSYGYNPYISKADPFSGAYLAVVESVAKLVAGGAPLDQCYLTFQEYFPRLGQDPSRWGQPVAALLGALKAQLGLGLAAIGGKDSMSGSFEDMDVPPTLVSFAIAVCERQDIHSPEFKQAGNRVALIKPDLDPNGLPDAHSLLSVWRQVYALYSQSRILSAWSPSYGGVIEGLFKMCLGNGIGCSIAFDEDELFAFCYGGILIETPKDETVGITIGCTTERYALEINGESISIDDLERHYLETLSDVYPVNLKTASLDSAPPTLRFCEKPKARSLPKVAHPRVLIPVFPGTNCEYDSEAAWRKVGAKPEIFVIRNQNSTQAMESVEYFANAVRQSQILFLPGGFSGGDEPDGSAKFIAAFLRNARIADEIHSLLERREGLIGGICNGFQALVKLGLLPFGKIIDVDSSFPTLTFNTIGRHQSRLARIRVASTMSPWLMKTTVDENYLVAVSHGEGRFVCNDQLLRELTENGQIATQYVDSSGLPTIDIPFNPNGSAYAVEGITSRDGRIFGKMGHTERTMEGLYINVPGNKDMPVFEGAVEFFN